MENKYIKPKGIAHKKYPLCGLDLMFGFHYNDVVHFLDAECDIAAFEPALQETVNRIPVLGGKIVKENGVLVLDTDGPGVQLVYEIAQQPAPAFGGEVFPVSGYEFFNSVPSIFSADISQMPLLTIKITSFSDGVRCIGIRHSHALMDGTALYAFMQTWAACLRETKERAFEFSRDVLIAIAEKDAALPSERCGISVVDGKPVSPAPKFFHNQLHAIRMAAADFDHLREHVRTQCEGVSLNDLMQAMIFKTFGLSSLQNDVEPALANISYDLRQAGVKLPLTYFGNAVLFRCLEISLGELRKMDLIALAQRIRELMRPANEDIAQDIGFYQAQYERGNYTRAGIFSEFQAPVGNGGLYINSVLQLPRGPIFDHHIGFDMVLPSNFGVRLVMLLPDVNKDVVLRLALDEKQIPLFEECWSGVFKEVLQIRNSAVLQ